MGQKRRFNLRPVTSGLPPLTDILSVRRYVSKCHKGDITEGVNPIKTPSAGDAQSPLFE
jgi:pyruvoyl-dependent arginine decarboxylase (PvlArgDC)